MNSNDRFLYVSSRLLNLFLRVRQDHHRYQHRSLHPIFYPSNRCSKANLAVYKYNNNDKLYDHLP